jgi:hypothetical protein
LVDQVTILESEAAGLRATIRQLETDRAAMLAAGFPHYARYIDTEQRWAIFSGVTAAACRLAQTDPYTFARIVDAIAKHLAGSCVKSTP